MNTQAMPALASALTGVLPDQVVRALMQALGNCQQPVSSRSEANFQPNYKSGQSVQGLRSDQGLVQPGSWSPSSLQPGMLPTASSQGIHDYRTYSYPSFNNYIDIPSPPGLTINGGATNFYGGSQFSFPMDQTFNVMNVFPGPTLNVGGSSIFTNIQGDNVFFRHAMFDSITVGGTTIFGSPITFSPTFGGPGTPGAPGMPGSPGLPGGPGIPSLPGIPGADGQRGNNGIGFRGARGEQGESGRDGRDGRPGFSPRLPPGGDTTIINNFFRSGRTRVFHTPIYKQLVIPGQISEGDFTKEEIPTGYKLVVEETKAAEASLTVEIKSTNDFTVKQTSGITAGEDETYSCAGSITPNFGSQDVPTYSGVTLSGAPSISYPVPSNNSFKCVSNVTFDPDTCKLTVDYSTLTFSNTTADLSGMTASLESGDPVSVPIVDNITHNLTYSRPSGYSLQYGEDLDIAIPENMTATGNLSIDLNNANITPSEETKEVFTSFSPPDASAELVMINAIVRSFPVG